MRKLLLTALSSLFFIFVHSQQFNTWYFGNAAGLTFNPGGASTPHAVVDGRNQASEGNSSICDNNGNILFYTNGEVVYDRTHQIMLNGDGLLGHRSAAQSSIIVPLPNNDSIYYIFTTDAFENNFANGYRYSTVNINHDGGKGEVVTKNVLLDASCTERLTAVRHANGVDVWIVGNEKNSNTFKCWLLTCNGLQPVPVVSKTGTILSDQEQEMGVMKASPDGKFLCQTNFAETGNFFQLFDFDNAAGTISNPRVISNPATRYLGCEFSPDSKLLYLTRGESLLIDQFEVTVGTSTSINATRLSIPAAVGFEGIQSGPDGKIYLNNYKTKLSVINFPDIKGTGCDFVQDQVDLAGRFGAYGLPNAINDEPLDPNNNFTYLVTDTCGGTVQFTAFTNLAEPVQWSWNFGDGSISNLQNPVHIFSPQNKIYSVRLVVTSPFVCGKIIKEKYVPITRVTANADFSFATNCDSGYVRFINASMIYPDDSASYVWDFGDGNTSAEKNPIHTYANSGAFFSEIKNADQA